MDSQCGTGNYCNQGACVPDTRPTPNCTTDSNCISTPSTPQACISGFCSYECTTGMTGDGFCKTVDNRFVSCGANPNAEPPYNGTCLTMTEAGAQCTMKSQCPAGKDCINNICQ
jgi:hypothetical protein